MIEWNYGYLKLAGPPAFWNHKNGNTNTIKFEFKRSSKSNACRLISMKIQPPTKKREQWCPLEIIKSKAIVNPRKRNIHQYPPKIMHKILQPLAKYQELQNTLVNINLVFPPLLTSSWIPELLVVLSFVWYLLGFILRHIWSQLVTYI